MVAPLTFACRILIAVCVFTYQLPIYIGIDAYNCIFSFQSSSEDFHNGFSVYPAKLSRSRKHRATPCLLRSTKWSFEGQRRSDGRKSIGGLPDSVKALYASSTVGTCLCRREPLVSWPARARACMTRLISAVADIRPLRAPSSGGVSYPPPYPLEIHHFRALPLCTRFFPYGSIFSIDALYRASVASEETAEMQ